MVSKELQREVELLSIDSVLNYINHRDPQDSFPYAEKAELSFLKGEQGLILRESKYIDSSELQAEGCICGEIAFNTDGTFKEAVFFSGQQQFFWDYCDGTLRDYEEWIYDEKLEDDYKHDDSLCDEQVYEQIIHLARQTGHFMEWLFFMYENFVTANLEQSLFTYVKMLELKSIRKDEAKGHYNESKSFQRRVKEVLPRGFRTHLYRLGGYI